jgi:hypothetical protein
MKCLKLSILLACVSILFSCSDDDITNEINNPTDPTEVIEETSTFHIAADVEINESAEVQIAPFTDLSEGMLSVVDNGTQMEGTRSAYLAEANGMIYNLNYGTGVIRELQPNSNGSYDVTAEVDAAGRLGTNPRFEVVGDNDETLLAFYVAKETNDDETEVTTTLQILDYDLPGLRFRTYTEIILGTYSTDDIYIGRVDAPVVLDGKIYIGTSQSKVGASRGDVWDLDGLQTIVMDYPSFENFTVTKTYASSGHNYGYRGRSMYVYNNDVYQINWARNDSDVVITKLNNGTYDDSFVLNITEKLGGGIFGSVNWFHIGGGKGYAAIEDKSIDNDNNWFIVYIDLNAETVQRVDAIPMSDMFAYQNSVVTGESTFNIAICPVDEDAYIWQIDGATATRGAQLDGGNVFVQGIY